MLLQFKAHPEVIGSTTLVRIPKAESKKLPSRGMVMLTGTIDKKKVTLPGEPDGQGSHWIALSKKQSKEVTCSLEAIKEWPEPQVPADITQALKPLPQAVTLWNDITPAARWDWIRWIRSTKNEETRAKRIGILCSKLEKGDRRPCCFNRNICTDVTVSKSGVLLER